MNECAKVEILCVEDSPSDAEMILRALRKISLCCKTIKLDAFSAAVVELGQY